MLKISYTSKEGLKKLREKCAEMNDGDITRMLLYNDRRYDFLKQNMRGWLILEAAKNFVPADFVDDKDNPQRIKEGWKAVRLLKKMLKLHSNREKNPAWACLFEKIDDGDEHTATAVNLWLASLENCFDILACADEDEAQSLNINDYCSAVLMFRDLIATGFKSNARKTFWDDFVYRILAGDVPQEPDPPYRKGAPNA